jgi:hypothetical protein
MSLATILGVVAAAMMLLTSAVIWLRRKYDRIYDGLE